MQPDQCGTEGERLSYEHGSNPTSDPGTTGGDGAVLGVGGAVPGHLTAPDQITRQNDGVWWSTYADDVTVWASGARAAEADAHLVERVPWPYQHDDLMAEVETLERNGVGYAAYPGDPYVVATGPTVEEAVIELSLHVPVPQPTGGSSGDKPPKLEEKPLPPV